MAPILLGSEYKDNSCPNGAEDDEEKPFLSKIIELQYLGVFISGLERLKIQLENMRPPTPNIYELKTVPEKLLYLKAIGVYDFLLKKYNKKITVAKVFAHLLSEKKPENISVLLAGLETPNNIGKNNPHTKSAVENAISALSEVNVDTSQLEEISTRFIKD